MRLLLLVLTALPFSCGEDAYTLTDAQRIENLEARIGQLEREVHELKGEAIDREYQDRQTSEGIENLESRVGELEERAGGRQIRRLPGLE